MPFTPPQLVRPLVVAWLACAGLALGGCFSKDPADVTGAIDNGHAAYASASPGALRASSEELGKRFEANPGDADTAIAYARVLRGLGQHVQAVAVLQQATLRNPDQLPILAAYGKALADAGRLHEAADVLSRAHTPERPDWRILSAQGAIADQLGRFDEAQRYYDTALKIVPGEPSVLSNQGLSFALARRLPEAERILRDAAQRPGADARVRQNLALVLGLQGKFQDAEATLRRDLQPAELAATMTELRKMGRQPNRWAAVRSGEDASAVAMPAKAAPTARMVQASVPSPRATPRGSAADLQ